MQNDSRVTRREFLRTTGAAAAAVGVAGAGSGVFAAGSDRLRVGLVGCGSRGAGAAMNCVLSSPGVEIAALGDVFVDRVTACYQRLKDDTKDKEWSCSQPWRHSKQVIATPETCFTGFDACQKVIASGVDLVILATPPHFRAAQLKAALEAGKHVFMEKPVAVDPVGIRSILASSELASQKRLAIVAGTQRRHQNSYLELMKRLHDGALGDLLVGEAYWNGPCTRTYGFYHERQPGWTDMEYVLRNWYFYSWLSGDHIVEQHVHNLDVMNWAMGTPPVEALAVGGRQWRVEPQFGNIYDHFGVRYKYPNGATVVSMARQINDTEPRVSELIIGSKGRGSVGRIEGANAWRWEGKNPNAYEQEHADLIASIRAGTPLNEGRQVAEATLTAIIGRMSAYTGRTVRFQWALEQSQLNLTPEPFRNGYQLGQCPMPPVPKGNEELV